MESSFRCILCGNAGLSQPLEVGGGWGQVLNYYCLRCCHCICPHAAVQLLREIRSVVSALNPLLCLPLQGQNIPK